MEIKIDKNLALFYGIMLRDGCISEFTSKNGRKHKIIAITCSYKDDQDFFKEIVHPLTELLRGKNVAIRKRPDKGTIELNFSDKKMFQAIKELHFPVGKKARIFSFLRYSFKII